MCNNCFKTKASDLIGYPPGCCQVEQGYYCVWNLEAMTMVCEEWVELCELYNVVRQISHITFDVVSERQRARTALNNLKRDAPFDQCKRFPWARPYVNVSCGVYGTIFQNVLSALDHKNRETEKELKFSKDKKQDDSNQTSVAAYSLDDASQQYRNNLKNLYNELCKRNEVFDRVRFENRYNLTWCVGQCPGDPSKNPSIPNPPFPPNPQPPNPQPPIRRNKDYYAGLYDALTEKGLTVSDFDVFKDVTDITFACFRDTEKLSNISREVKFPDGTTRVFVFATGNYSRCSEDKVPGYIYNPANGILTEYEDLKIFGGVSKQDLVHNERWDSNVPSKYVPPHARNSSSSEQNSDKLDKLFQLISSMTKRLDSLEMKNEVLSESES